MQQNITKVSERGERLDTLQDKTDSLATQANGFRRGANRVRKQMWWKDMKMRMCIIVGIIILLVVIIVPSALQQPASGRDTRSSTGSHATLSLEDQSNVFMKDANQQIGKGEEER
ncbi:hypothetical protein D0861_06821 [Hortaea werneckii]|uniref:V-SNARE coiled-coil homology domain-containing protein n=1 Tax=Hortaea werneckii TaxID=91943 RepID=A0A3M7F7E4_HORWE|nr:hypothetical protein D0861_06821 [Hortaea werneckii]